MKTYLISYDLNEAESDEYNQLFDYIKSFGTWANITKSLWAIKTDSSAAEIRDAVKRIVPDGSRIFVIKSSGVAAWSNVICSNAWLKEHL